MNASTDQPANIPSALTLVLTTGVSLAALLLPGLQGNVALQIAIIAFGNALILLGQAVYLNSRTTSNSSPVLQAGTDVAVQGTSDMVRIEATPPGPEGYQGDPPGYDSGSLHG